jgi:putative endonuclease
MLKASDWLRHQARRRQGNPAHILGLRGEDLAHRFLRQSGYRVVARNFGLADNAAEIDIIARRGDTVVFVEVKSRTSDEFGSPERQIGPEKLRHMIRAATVYARQAAVP